MTCPSEYVNLQNAAGDSLVSMIARSALLLKVLLPVNEMELIMILSCALAAVTIRKSSSRIRSGFIGYD